MKTKHTPGPWKAEVVDKYFQLTAGVNTLISDGPYDEAIIDVSDADARLIAASPEMLDALYVAEAELENSQEPWSKSVLKCVRDAIAKATGGDE